MLAQSLLPETLSPDGQLKFDFCRIGIVTCFVRIGATSEMPNGKWRPLHYALDDTDTALPRNA